MDESDDAFCDIISLNSLSTYKTSNDYISLSRNTIYHSVEEFELASDAEESRRMEPFSENPPQKVTTSDTETITYSQWRNRFWNKFQDGMLNVDFVLAYTSSDREHAQKREIFERNLENEGLLLEREKTQKLHFVKINVPLEVLSRYSEILKIRLPMKEIPGAEYRGSQGENRLFSRIWKCLNVELDEKKFPKQKYSLTAEYSRSKSYLFDTETENFFPPSVRISVINFVLERQKFTESPEDVGIYKLLSDGVYKAAYPLHDGDISTPNCQRSLLFEEWASVKKLFKFQPIDSVKDYFGVKFALYFAWLGFYTHMLIPASVAGILCLLYGWATLSQDTLANDVCDPSFNVTMCPTCDSFCDYWKLSDSCAYTKVTRLFDNPATVVFAVFMSFWATLYLELWKRYSAEISHRWGLSGFDLQAEHPRPQYLTRLIDAKKKKLNVVTQMYEPAVSFWRVKLPSILLSYTIIIILIILTVTAVFGVVVYRMSLLTSEYIYGDRHNSYKPFIVPITSGVINLICIVALNMVYDRLSEWLTEMELHRTQTEYDDSLTLKTYIFQFVNYYSSIFYIAFFKGKFVGYPAKYNRIFGLRQEECALGGCLMELCIQLAVIMIGNQALNTVVEMVTPIAIKLYNSFRSRVGLRETVEVEDPIICCNQWTEDYKLVEIGPKSLFYEYLEMILQYGFVTIFVTAFPVAPLFALLNNVFEMRLDAKKFIKFHRRPVPKIVKSIGVWYRIMDIIGRISVISNAIIIAFSSNFIPQLVYTAYDSPDHTTSGFLNSSLAYFDTVDFKAGTEPQQPENGGVELCRYFGYRNPPTHDQPYKHSTLYWHVMIARLVFVVLYQNMVGFVQIAVQWAIPDISRKLRDQIKREAYLTRNLIVEQEALQARRRRSSSAERRKSRNSTISNHTGNNSLIRRPKNLASGDDP